MAGGHLSAGCPEVMETHPRAGLRQEIVKGPWERWQEITWYPNISKVITCARSPHLLGPTPLGGQQSKKPCKRLALGPAGLTIFSGRAPRWIAGSPPSLLCKHSMNKGFCGQKREKH